MAHNKLEPIDIDITAAIAAGVQHVLDHADLVEKIGGVGVPAAAIVGAVPALGEQFALVADDMAKQLRANYQNGDLLAGGAKLVAAAIRAAVLGGSVLEDLATVEAEPEAKAA